MQSFVLFSAFD